MTMNAEPGTRVSSVGDTRTIFVGVKELGPEAEQQRFKSNRIKTSKYTVLNFIPKNLFEQFRRVANFYFLIMCVIAVSITSPVSPWTSILPLAFVILVTGFKQGYEDYLRYCADKEVNYHPVTVIRNGSLQELQAQQVKVGDVVRVVSDSEVPCDLVLLTTSDANGKAYITTANLDGETNLKTLVCPRMLRYIGVNDQVAELRARVECEQPSADLYHFFGKIRLLEQPSQEELQRAPSGSEHFIRSVDPSLQKVNGVAVEQRRSVDTITSASVPMSPGVRIHRRAVSFEVGSGAADQQSGRRASVRSEDGDTIYETDVSRSAVGMAVSSMSTGSFRRGLARRESKRSDVRRSARSFMVKEKEEEPVEDLRRASEQGLSAPLGPENLLLRGHRLKNTDYVFGCAVYTGQETKLALNSKLTSNKFSSVEKSINRFLLFFMGLLVFEVVLCTVLKVVSEDAMLPEALAYLAPTPRTAGSILEDMSSFIIIFNYIIPISLYVTIEMQKFLGTAFFEWDLDLYDEELNESAICNTSDLNEELGQIQYLFTDKTGTLTENTMIFRRCNVDGKSYVDVNGRLMKVNTGEGREDLKHIPYKEFPPDLQRFFLAMAVCHSVQVSSDTGNNDNNNTDEPMESRVASELTYQASSPDEKALVEASARLGVAFLGEQDDEIVVCVDGDFQRFTTLECLEFTSDRKRMSVIVEDVDKVVWLFCKGAESHVVPLVVSDNIDQTMAAVDEYAMRGLRAMVIGYRQMTRPEYDELAAIVTDSRQDLSGHREESITAAYDQLERGLVLLGATGVEDKLQEGVGETLESMRVAGIKVWILTGDKVETAVNISFSCGHFKSGTRLLYLTEIVSETSCLQAIFSLQQDIDEQPLESYGLIVDGVSLKFALKLPEPFVQICMCATAVVCCRMSPLQKCEVVQLIKNSPDKPITAAIGDGANDVSMIQEAHVGIGLFGKEGRQAVRCADFAFGRFRFLRKSFLVHGHWYYLRIATLVHYFFYKNIVFITPQFFFCFFNLFSTQPLYSSWYLTLFNVIFAELPILMYGLFEQNYPAKMLLEYPQLYQINRNDALMSWKCFFWWNSLGLWHALVLFFLPYLMFYDDVARLADDNPLDIWTFGTLIYHVVVFVVNLKLLIYSYYWSWGFVGSIAVSILAFILFAVAMSFVITDPFTRPSGAMYWVYLKLASSPNFWLLTVVMIVLSFIPDVAFPILYTETANCSRRAWRQQISTMVAPVKRSQLSGAAEPEIKSPETSRTHPSSLHVTVISQEGEKIPSDRTLQRRRSGVNVILLTPAEERERNRQAQQSSATPDGGETESTSTRL